jgi:hypothetical protein
MEEELFDCEKEHYSVIIPTRTIDGDETNAIVDTDTDMEGIYDNLNDAFKHVERIVKEYPTTQGYIFKCIPFMHITGKVKIKRRVLVERAE